eukprot:g23032.t1
MDESKFITACSVETDEDILSSAESEESDGEWDYDYLPQQLTGSQRLVRFFQARKYKTSALTLIVCFSLAQTAEFVADEDFRQATMASMGEVPRANYCSIAFFAQVLSFITAITLSTWAEGGFTYIRRVLTMTRIFHFGLIGIIFLISEGFMVAESQLKQLVRTTSKTH